MEYGYVGVFTKEQNGGRQMAAMRKMRMQENKTNEIDTLVIAETIRFGRYKASSVPQEKLPALRELCRNWFYLIDMGSGLKRKITALLLLYLNQLQSFQDSAASLERRIGGLFSQFDSTLISIIGIGPVLGAVILSEIRDISCFASADKLAAYAGLNPKVKQSGDMKSSAVHMSKRGSPYLRRAIWMAGAIAVQYDLMFKAYYEKKSAVGLVSRTLFLSVLFDSFRIFMLDKA